MKSDTPRTDGAMGKVNVNLPINIMAIVKASFARELERELNEANSTIESLREELAKAREEAEGFADLLNHKTKQRREK